MRIDLDNLKYTPEIISFAKYETSCDKVNSKLNIHLLIYLQKLISHNHKLIILNHNLFLNITTILIEDLGKLLIITDMLSYEDLEHWKKCNFDIKKILKGDYKMNIIEALNELRNGKRIWSKYMTKDDFIEFDRDGILVDSTGEEVSLDEYICFENREDLFENCWKASKAPKYFLDKEEKEYLASIIEPFKKRDVMVEKYEKDSDQAEIIIYVDDYMINLPPFKRDLMYRNMSFNKEYSLKELKLFKD